MEVGCVLLIALLAEREVVTDLAVETVVSSRDGFMALVTSEPSVEPLVRLFLLNLFLQ